MLNSKDITRILVGVCESDESSADNIDLGTAVDDTEYLMDNIPDVATEDTKYLQDTINVENVRIVKANDNFYIEFSELYGFMESCGYTAPGAMDAILERYRSEAPISNKNLFITVPRSLFEETITLAEAGDPRAMTELSSSSKVLRAIVNTGLPIRKM